MITKRGKRVRAVAIVVGLWALWFVISHVWWIGIEAPQADFLGWCFGDMTECVGL